MQSLALGDLHERLILIGIPSAQIRRRLEESTATSGRRNAPLHGGSGKIVDLFLGMPSSIIPNVVRLQYNESIEASLFSVKTLSTGEM